MSGFSRVHKKPDFADLNSAFEGLKGTRTMRDLCIALGILVLSGAAWGNEQAIAEHCSGEWPNDREMYAYCVDEQRKAVRSLAKYSGAIRAHCESEWNTNYEMVVHCIKEQQASQGAVARAPQDEIATRCAREWPNEYDMQEHCAKERRTAKDSIERNYSGPLRRACERQWNTEYEMVEHCIEEGGE